MYVIQLKITNINCSQDNFHTSFPIYLPDSYYQFVSVGLIIDL